MKPLNEEELDKVNGGVIVQYQGKYWAVAVNGHNYANRNSVSYAEIAGVARKYGWSTEPISQEEFRLRYGREFNPEKKLGAVHK